MVPFLVVVSTCAYLLDICGYSWIVFPAYPISLRFSSADLVDVALRVASLTFPWGRPTRWFRLSARVMFFWYPSAELTQTVVSVGACDLSAECVFGSLTLLFD